MPGQNNFLPFPGRFGVMPVCITGRLDGTIAGTDDTAFNVGGYPMPAQISGAIISAAVVPTSGSALTGVLRKYDASANAYVVLSDAVDLLTLTALEGTALTLLPTLGVADLTLDVGDTLDFFVTAAGAVTGQATDLFLNIEVLVLR
jgi:hypothetical protein